MRNSTKNRADCGLATYLNDATLSLESMNLENLTSTERNECEELLNSIDYMKKTLKFKQLKELVLKVHPYSISHTEKSGWYTDIKKEGESKRYKLKRTTEESLISELAKHYRIELPEDIKTICDLYPKWFAWKETARNAETMRRYRFEWKAFYETEILSQSIITAPMKNLTKQQLRDWAEALIKKHQPNRAKFTNMFAIMNQLYLYSEQEELNIGDITVWEKAKKIINMDLIVEDDYIEDDTQVFTDEERLVLQREVRKDLVKYEKQASSAGLQILFMLETALRPGEACGLKFSDVNLLNKTLSIKRQANNERVKIPKNKSYRTIPLTDQALELLTEIREFNAKHEFNADWVFQSNNANYEYRLSYNAADRKLRKLCNRIETEAKSPHKLRKTAISVICDSVNVKTAQKFAGHKDISTTLKHYDFDRDSREEQSEKINKALSLKPIEKKLELTEQIVEILDSNQNLGNADLAKLLVKALNLAS